VEDRKNPSLTTTYGVGQLIMAAAKKRCKKIIVGLGGSSTNDGGCGAAAAVGVKFYDKKGNEFIPIGKTLIDIDRIDLSHKAKELDNIEIITMCDIDNPMYGPTGAAYIFGPQKGADEKMILELDKGLKNLCDVIERETGKDLKDVPGSGAAGAMGAGMIAFFNSVLQMGIETVLDTVKFDEIIEDADMIFTGEGRIDSQSLRGKVVIGVGKRAKNKNIPVTVIAGGAANNIDDAYDMGVTSIFTINRLPEDFEISRHKSKENLEATIDNILRLIKSVYIERGVQ
jgi:glycerate kinase